MAKTVSCNTHGERSVTYVCSHLAEESHGRGFNSRKATKRNPLPDAWCDDCELVRAAHGGWNEESEKLTTIQLICSGCYERSRIRNTKPVFPLSGLTGLRWKCGSCEEWHTGPMLDVAYDRPHYWSSQYDPGHRWSLLPSGDLDRSCKSFLDSEYCAVEDKYFFVRGIIEVPILGAAEDFRWGVWGSLSRENFEILIRADERNEQPEKKRMFSWLSSRVSDYPDTLSLKMTAVVQEPGTRPVFYLERADHPLATEFHDGITPGRVKEIMFQALPPQPE